MRSSFTALPRAWGKRMMSQNKTPPNMAIPGNLPMPPTFQNLTDERKHKKEILAGSFRLFSKYGFDEGAAGHITFRDPEFPETVIYIFLLFWLVYLQLVPRFTAVLGESFWCGL